VNQVHLKAVSKVDAKGKSSQKWMLAQGAKNGGGVKDKCYKRDQKRMLEPEVDAQARSGCSSQKWMLELEMDARARIGCPM